MRARSPVALFFLLCIGCSSAAAVPDAGHRRDAAAPDGGTPIDVDGGSPPPMRDGGAPLHAGSVTRSCASGIPAAGTPVDTSAPDSVVGSGSADSCTFGELRGAVAGGGVIVFDCGADPVTIPIDETLELRTDRDTVIDGGGLVTLDGQDAVQILHYHSDNFRALETRVTLQHLTLVRGHTTPTEAIPTAPAPCSQGFNDGEGGALYMRDGSLTVIDCIFADNHGAPLGPDTGGGAMYVLGSLHGVLIVHSTFMNNGASNGAGVGALFAELDVYDSLFTGNVASGHDANNDDASRCDYINNGQHEIGSGGNGGALYSDGAGVDITLCGDEIMGNAAGDNAFGGGLFFTSNDFTGTLSISDTTMTGNTGGHWTQVREGTVSDVGSAVGTNCRSITVVNSTLQDM